MKVLVTPQLNASMLRLDKASQQEVAQLFSLVSEMTMDQFFGSPLLTKLKSGTGDIYTLRTHSTRVFCSFDEHGDLLFLDVKEVKFQPTEPSSPQEREVTLFGSRGDPKVYIAQNEENTIYSFDGRPLAYLDGINIYGFNGNHLGWFEDGIVWDHKGLRVGFTSSKCPAFTKFEPFKGFKRFKPFKSFQKFAPIKPFKSHSVSNVDLLTFFETGQR